MTVLIQLTVAGADVGPFDIYSDVNYSLPVATNVSKASLLAGYSVTVDDATTIIRVQSQGECKNQIDISVSGTTPAFYYLAIAIPCSNCTGSRPGLTPVRSSSALTISNFYIPTDPPFDTTYQITGVDTINTGIVLNASTSSVDCATACGSVS